MEKTLQAYPKIGEATWNKVGNLCVAGLASGRFSARLGFGHHGISVADLADTGFVCRPRRESGRIGPYFLPFNRVEEMYMDLSEGFFRGDDNVVVWITKLAMMRRIIAYHSTLGKRLLSGDSGWKKLHNTDFPLGFTQISYQYLLPIYKDWDSKVAYIERGNVRVKTNGKTKELGGYQWSWDALRDCF